MTLNIAAKDSSFALRFLVNPRSAARVGHEGERKIHHDVGDMREMIDAPLSGEELAARYRALCEDPAYASVPGKIELDIWGRMVLTPMGLDHGVLQGRLVHALKAALGGEASVQAPVVTPAGLLVADVVWASGEFMKSYGGETPLPLAPEICIEVLSPSTSITQVRAKIDAYLAADAREVWIVYSQSRRCHFHGRQGPLARSRYPVNLAPLFT
jgi:Uma2 family endonuclease